MDNPRNRAMTSTPLKRILGTPTAFLIGMGVALGSGIFRTPGDIAQAFPDWRMVLVAWVIGGLIILAQGMVTAELATRFPKAGGEYVFLREAYGDFPAFFFGWAYTIFIVGGGAATIAAAVGDFACELFGLAPNRSGLIGAAAIVAVTLLNAAGLRIGASAQNLLTSLKILALVAVGVIGIILGSGPTVPVAVAKVTNQHGWDVMLLGILPILWTYNGTTDAGKLAEEIKDVRRTLPLALIGSTVAMIAIYVFFNFALLRLVPLEEMVKQPFVPGMAVERQFGVTGRQLMLVAAILVCLGSLSSTVLATVRVTFALARDGLAFRWMSHMSKQQAPIPALLVVGFFALILVLNRKFREVLDIYFLAAAILFGLTYASLIVFRFRDRTRRAEIFYCPFGIGVSAFLILFQLALAVNIIHTSPKDAGWTIGLLVIIGALYLAWNRFSRRNESQA